jgi:hypothetical protein
MHCILASFFEAGWMLPLDLLFNILGNYIISLQSDKF